MKWKVGQLRIKRNGSVSEPQEGSFAAAAGATLELDGYLFPGFSLSDAGENYQAGILQINGDVFVIMTCSQGRSGSFRFEPSN